MSKWEINNILSKKIDKYQKKNLGRRVTKKKMYFLVTKRGGLNPQNHQEKHTYILLKKNMDEKIKKNGNR